MPGKEGGNPSEEGLSSHLPKTFDWWGGGAEEVQKNEKKPFRQIAATPLPHYKSLRRERGGLEGEREALLQKGSLPLPPHIKMLFAPRGVALVPEGVERLRVTQGIHALPETGVAVHG